MKTTIITLGLAVVCLTTTNAAEFKSQDLDQNDSITLLVRNTQEQNQLVLVSEETSNNTGDSAEAAVFSPSSVASPHVKTIDEVVAENKQITESKEEIAQPLSLDYTVEDRIAEGNQIIESSISNEVFALDFEKINRNVKPVTANSNAIKASELKL